MSPNNRQNKKKRAWIRTWIALSAILLGFACAHFQIATPNPVTGKRELVLISEQEEIEIGTEVYIELQVESGGLYTKNPEINEYVDRIGRKIAALSDRPDLPFEFVVIDSDIPNAWALPGGKIAINTGLINILDNEAELASILAHEIVHATARHTAQHMERDILLNSVSYFDVAVNPLGLINTTLDVNTELKDLKYSRDAEREADIYGMEYMARAGYDTHAAASAHRKLKNFYAEEDMTEGFFDVLYYTHPRDDERIHTCEQLAENYPQDGFKGESEFSRIMQPLKQ